MTQHDIIMHVLGEYSKDVGKTVKTFVSLEKGGKPKAHAKISTL